MDNPMIETQGLTLRFGKRAAVDGLSVQVQAGEIFGLLGPNGAGKTTTIKVLTTLLPPNEGKARVAGFDVVREEARVRRVIGYVPQLLSADGALTGHENLMLSAALYNIPRRERKDRVQAALALMGLEESADRLVRQYSGGMIRRLEIAQSTLHAPRVLFLDEPTTGLDPLGRIAVWERIAQMRDMHATTIFFTTHRMEEADEWCSRVAIMNLGKVVTVGSPAELKASVGREGATLNDVFIHYAGNAAQPEGRFRDIARERRNARRLG
jgi:ABC-2 type transport system ATP-binding protein